MQGLGCMVQGSGFRVQGSEFRVQGLGRRVQGSGFRVQGLLTPHLDHEVQSDLILTPGNLKLQT